MTQILHAEYSYGAVVHVINVTKHKQKILINMTIESCPHFIVLACISGEQEQLGIENLKGDKLINDLSYHMPYNSAATVYHEIYQKIFANSLCKLASYTMWQWSCKIFPILIFAKEQKVQTNFVA